MVAYPETVEDTVIYSRRKVYGDKDIDVTMLDGSTLNIWGEVYYNGELLGTGGGGGFTQEQIEDIVASLFADGTHTNCTVTYDDTTGSLSINVTGVPASSLASNAETIAGILTTKAVTPAGLAYERPYIDVRTYGAVGDGVADDTAEIQAALTAVPNGKTLKFTGSFLLNGAITLSSKSNVTLDFTDATITQTSPTTQCLVLASPTNVKVIGGKWVGLGTNYVNNSGVYLYSAITINGTGSYVIVSGCNMYNFAGGGVRILAGVPNIVVENCIIKGPGLAEITPLTDNYGGGIIADGLNTTDWSIIDCDISEYPQGIVTNHNSRVKVIGNYIHDIIGQHGMYFGALTNSVISNNIIRTTGLQGIKIQLIDSSEAYNVVISDNTLSDLGSHAILLTRASGTALLRRITVVGNTVRGTSGGDGVNCLALTDSVVANNVLSDCRVGISVTTDCTDLLINSNRISECDRQGITVNPGTRITILGNIILNPGMENNAATEFGIHTAGVTTDVVVKYNSVIDLLGNMSYGMYFTTSAATFSITDNYTIGATGHGIRFVSAEAIREWARNDANGTSGRILNHPTEALGEPGRRIFGTAAPTTGTWIQGDIVWNRTPTASGTIGWVCTTTGTPGTWTIFGQIGGGSTTFATNAETIAGTETTKALNPATLAYERPYIDVRTYGAVGNGVTDDRAAIQAAIDAAEAKGGGEVFVPPGNYKLNSALDAFSEPIHFRGSGAGHIPTTAVTTLTFAAGIPGITIGAGGAGSTIEGLCLQSSSTVLGTDDGIVLQAGRCRIIDVIANDFGRYGVNIDSTSFNCNLNHLNKVRTSENKSHGFYLKGSNSNVNQLIGCSAVLNEGRGFFLEGCQTNILIAPHADQNVAGDYYDNAASNQYYDLYAEALGTFEIGAGSSYGVLISSNHAKPTIVSALGTVSTWTIQISAAWMRQMRLVNHPAESTQTWKWGMGSPGAGHFYFQNESVGPTNIWTVNPSTHQMTINQKLLVSGELEMDAALNHDGTTVGFYGTTPVAKPTSVTAQAALEALGLGATLIPDASKRSVAQTINAQTGTTYTLVLADADKLVTLSNAAAIALTIPTNASVAFPVGTNIDLAQLGAGQVTVGGTPTLRYTPTAKFRAQYSTATLIKLATDEWLLVGDLASS